MMIVNKSQLSIPSAEGIYSGKRKDSNVVRAALACNVQVPQARRKLLEGKRKFRGGAVISIQVFLRGFQD